MESILTSIKKLLGIPAEYTHFDQDIIIHINTAFMTLKQLGAGPSVGFMIEDESSVWDDFISTDYDLLMVKTYIYLKVKQVFDPPTSSIVAEAMNRNISELEWRLNVAVDKSTVEEDDTGDE